MPVLRTSRREFVQLAAGTVVATSGRVVSLAADASSAAAGSSRTVRLGGPVFNAPKDPEELARAHRELGYRAAYCPPVELKDTARIREVSRAFAKHDVVIAEVGRWCNLLDPNAATRTANLQRVTEGLALAEELGALCCVDIAGSYNPKVWYGPHPDNLSPKFFDETVENARRIIDAVKPKRAKFCFEMMGWALPDSVESSLRLVKAVQRDAFGVHLDPCNLINSPARFYHNRQLLEDCFDQLGPWIVSCHAKDIAWDVEMQVHFREVTLGTGSLDYTTYLKRLAALPRDVPLMIEHMANAQEYDRSRQHLIDVGQKIGVRFA
jgi:sugar phosphate isomerase/epimerase